MKKLEFVVGTHGQARHMDQKQVVSFGLAVFCSHSFRIYSSESLTDHTLNGKQFSAWFLEGLDWRESGGWQQGFHFLRTTKLS